MVSIEGNFMGCAGCSAVGSCRKNSVKLSTLEVGDECVVVDILAGEDIKLRIMEMGLVSTTALKVTKKSPLGDPISIKIRGYELVLRNREAEAIVVNKV
jgi:ferrous iron transport protein A